MFLHAPMLQQLRALLLSSGLLLGVLLASGQAQVTTTITSDGTLGTTVTQSGTIHDITGGTRPRNGPNLFHSFDRFNVGPNDTARFSGPTGIVNILSRVTGGQQSLIDGQLQSAIPGANLYLLNPSGVVFGPHAILDISGSFHVSTADFLRFADGATFSAHVGQNSTLTVAPPSAFGFLSPAPAPITVQDSILQVLPGQTLAVVGGDIKISGGRLSAPSGQVHLASVASAGDVVSSAPGESPALQVGTFQRLGEVTIMQGAVDASGIGPPGSGGPGGTVLIRSGRLLLDQSFLFAETSGSIDGAKRGLDIAVTEDIHHTRGGIISAASVGTGNAGDIKITARSLHIDGALIGAGTFGAGGAGTVAVEVGTLTLTNGAQLDSGTVSSGHGGKVMVTATEAITLQGTTPDGSMPSGIFANARGMGEQAGNAGVVDVKAPRVSLSQGAQIGSNSNGIGNGGTITIMATEAVSLTENALIDASGNGGGMVRIWGGRLTAANASIVAFTGERDGAPRGIDLHLTEDVVLDNSSILAGSAGRGNVGEIRVEAGTLTLRGGALMSSLASGAGKGGNITVSAWESVSISGSNDQGTSSGIAAFAAAEPGHISLWAPSVTLDGGIVGTPSLTAGGFVGGRAGDIVVKADHLTLNSGGGIISGTATDSNGGSITIETGQLTVKGGATISASSGFRDITTGNIVAGRGAAGNVTVTVSESASLSGRGSGLSNHVQSGSGNAGDIEGQVGRLTISEGAQIASSTLGPGAGGSVMVTASDTLTLAGTSPTGRLSSILATTEGTMGGAGAAGSIVVQAPRILVKDGAQISSGTMGPGAGGSVTVLASDTLTLAGVAPNDTFASGIFATTERTAGSAGAAGSIVVQAPHILVSDGATINSSTFGPGLGGSVMVTASDTLTLAGTSPTGRLSSILATTEGTMGGAGAAGSIVVQAPHILVRDGAQINSGTSGPGVGGNVTVLASDTLTLAGSTPTGAFFSGIFANAQGLAVGAGAAGSIVVQAPRIMVSDGAQIISGSFGPGAGGSVMVTATDTLTLTGVAPNPIFPSGILANAQGIADGAGAAGSVVVQAPRILVRDGAQIISSTFGPGAGGSVMVTATDTLTLTGVAPNDIAASGISATTERTAGNAGAAGSIVVQAPHILVSDGAAINGSTLGPGAGGGVTVTASDTLTLTGTTPTGRFSGIVARAFGAGMAGSIVAQAPHILASNGAAISGSTLGPGAGGSVTVTASDTLTLAGTSPTGRLSSISATTERTAGNAGAAGSIVVQAPRIMITDGAAISSSSFGPGAGGSVMVTATDTVNITGQESGLSASTAGQGRGGDVLLQARQVQLTNGATISAESTGPGNAGNVTIVAGDTFQSTNSRVVTRATQADGGNVQITAPTLVRLRNSAITAEVGGGPQTVGGNITIDPQFVLLQNSQIVANAFEGQGGNIRIQAQRAFLADPASIVSASSALGINGIVNIQAPVTSISGAVAPLQQEFAPIAELLRDRCVGRLREGRVSRFLLGGRDGIPSEPGSLLLSPLMQPDPREHREPAGTPARTGQVQEPAWYAQVGILEGLDAECAKWTGQKGPTVGKKR